MIDAHQHFWRIARGDYDWLDPTDAVLYRDFEASHLSPLLAESQVEGTILVQAAPTVAETRFLLEVADETPFVLGVVGWMDLAAPDPGTILEKLRRAGPLVGIRPMIQDIADPDWMLRDEVRPGFELLVELDLSLDALVLPEHLPRLRRLLALCPDLDTVIDHGAKPAIAAGAWQPWADDMAALAEETSAHCKLSGLVTEAATDWTIDSLRPYVDHLIATFGPERLIWGSDWPVVNKAGGFRRWRETSLDLLSGVDDADRAAIFRNNAARFYKLTKDRSESSSRRTSNG